MGEVQPSGRRPIQEVVQMGREYLIPGGRGDRIQTHPWRLRISLYHIALLTFTYALEKAEIGKKIINVSYIVDLDSLQVWNT